MSREWVAHRLATGLPSTSTSTCAPTRPVAADSVAPTQSVAADSISPTAAIRIRSREHDVAQAAMNGVENETITATAAEEDMAWLKQPIGMSLAQLNRPLGPQSEGRSQTSSPSPPKQQLPATSQHLLTAGTRPCAYVSDQHSRIPRPISHRDMRHVDNDVFGVTRRLHGSDRPIHHSLHPGVAESQGFKSGAYRAQLVRGAPGDLNGLNGLATLGGWIGPGAARGAAATAHRYPWREEAR